MVDLVKVLEDAETLEEVFEKLKGIDIKIYSLENLNSFRIKKGKKDYAIGSANLKSSFTERAIHPYRSNIVYEICSLPS